MGEENHAPAAVETEPAKAQEEPKQKHGICPYCEAEKGGLVWDFFENVAQIGGHVMMLVYATCSCEQCGKIVSATFKEMRPAGVQPADSTNLLIAPRRHRH